MGLFSHDIRTIKSSQLKNNSYDLVVSNPPFRRQKTGLISPTDEKAIARHEIKLRSPGFNKRCLLSSRDKGRFCIIYHPSRLVELIDSLKKSRWNPRDYNL